MFPYIGCRYTNPSPTSGFLHTASAPTGLTSTRSLLNRDPTHLAEMPRLIWQKVTPDVSHVIISQLSAYCRSQPIRFWTENRFYYTVSDGPIILSRHQWDSWAKNVLNPLHDTLQSEHLTRPRSDTKRLFETAQDKNERYRRCHSRMYITPSVRVPWTIVDSLHNVSPSCVLGDANYLHTVPWSTSNATTSIVENCFSHIWSLGLGRVLLFRGRWSWVTACLL